MNIILQNITKTYDNQLIFANINAEINNGDILGIIGNNGSGKSTLIQIIGNFKYASKGEIFYKKNNKNITSEEIYKNIYFVSPYNDMVDDFTVKEMLVFHQKIKGLLPNINILDVLENMQLKKYSDKQYKQLSTGYKQRLKLAIALFSNVEILLLDEPFSNIDNEGIEIFSTLFENYFNNRICVICSNNNPHEMKLINKTIKILEYKTIKV